MKELLPAFLVFVLLAIVYAFFRTAVGGVKELNGVFQAAHATLHMNYGKKLA